VDTCRHSERADDCHQNRPAAAGDHFERKCLDARPTAVIA